MSNPFISPRFNEGGKLFLANPSYTALWMDEQRKQRSPLLGELQGTLSYLSMRAQTYTGGKNLFDTKMFAYHYASFHVLYTEVIMAKKISTEKSQERAPWLGFLERRLTEDELADADNWTPSEADIWDAVERFIIAGIRVQLSYSTRLKLATCTLTDYRPDSSTAGYALSAQDANAALALKLAIFKHEHLLQNNWQALLTQGTQGRRG